MDEQRELTESETLELVKIRREKLSSLVEDGKNPFEITTFDRTATTNEIKENFEKFENQTAVVAGRLMSKRIMGKASFAHIMDGDGKLQGYFSRDDLGEAEYADFKKLDIGDIVGIEGFIFKTKTGEISIHAKKVTLLAKSLLPLPEKFHGLKDPDQRFRRRYVDLIVNPEVKEVFVKRSKIISTIREVLDKKGFIEVETPVLNTLAGGANARPFITHHNTLDIDMYMRIATELHLKRCIVGGFEKVYEIGRQFRNEGMDTRHNPEFTTIELYQAYADYHDMMDITEELFTTAAEKVCGGLDITYQGQQISLKRPWERLTMVEAVKKYTGLDFEKGDLKELIKKANGMGLDMPSDTSWGNALYKVFDAFVEEKLTGPVFITDYPVEVSPLAKKKTDDKRLTERFEFFIFASEGGNAFSELNDPIDQRARFEQQMLNKAKGDEEAQPYDEDFCNALEYGMPPTGGLGIGIDRMVMFLTDSASIRDVLLFPTMKPIKEPKGGSCNNNAPAGAYMQAVTAEAKSEEEKIDFSKVEIEPLFKDYVDFETFSKSDFRAVKVLACEAVPKSKKLLKFTLDDGTGENRTILSGIHEYYQPEELVGKTCIAIVNLPPRAMMGIDSCGMLISAVHSEEGKDKLHLLMVDSHIPAGAKLY